MSDVAVKVSEPITLKARLNEDWLAVAIGLLVFGLASAKELDTAEVRLFTGKQPFMFSRRRWEAPLIEALYGNCDEP